MYIFQAILFINFNFSRQTCDLGKYLKVNHSLFVLYLEGNHTLFGKKYTLFGNLAVATLKAVTQPVKAS